MTDAVLETDRLLLRELRLDDTDDLHQIQGDPETMRFYRSSACGWRRNRSAQACPHFIYAMTKL